MTAAANRSAASLRNEVSFPPRSRTVSASRASSAPSTPIRSSSPESSVSLRCACSAQASTDASPGTAGGAGAGAAAAASVPGARSGARGCPSGCAGSSGRVPGSPASAAAGAGTGDPAPVGTDEPGQLGPALLHRGKPRRIAVQRLHVGGEVGGDVGD